MNVVVSAARLHVMVIYSVIQLDVYLQYCKLSFCFWSRAEEILSYHCIQNFRA